jgi:transposase InsO family protein
MWCGPLISNTTPPLTAVRSRSCPPSMSTPANASAGWLSDPSPPSGLATELDDIVADHGSAPRVLRLDNGPEMIADALGEWAGTRTGMLFIPPGEPWRNPFIESFHGRLRDERLNIQRVLVAGPRAHRHWRLEARIQPSPAAFGARLLAASPLRRLLPPLDAQ